MYVLYQAVSLPKPNPGGYIINLLKFCHENVSHCFGCGGHLKEGGYPSSPRDLIVVTRAKRHYIKDGVQHEGTLGNVYFHFNEQCIKSHNSYFVSSVACAWWCETTSLAFTHRCTQSSKIEYVNQ